MLLNLSRFTFPAALALLLFAALPCVMATAQDSEAAGAKAAETAAAETTDDDGHETEPVDDSAAQTPADEADSGAERAGHQSSGHQASEHQASKHNSDGHESSGHAGGLPPLLQFDIGSAVCNILIFLGVFAILSKFVWPLILGGLQAREDKIHDDLEGAEKANSTAQELLTAYESRLSEAANEVRTMLADARKDSEAAGQRILEEAKAEGDRQRERAIADIETAKKVALADLAGQTSEMAINAAKQIVGRELKAADHAELIRKSLDRLPSNNRR